MFQIVELATPKASGINLIGLFWFFSIMVSPPPNSLSHIFKEWKAVKYNFNTFNQLHILCLFNLSGNSKRTGVTWPGNCVWAHSQITFDLLEKESMCVISKPHKVKLNACMSITSWLFRLVQRQNYKSCIFFVQDIELNQVRARWKYNE